MKPYFEESGIVIYHSDCREILPIVDGYDSLVLTDPPYGVNLSDMHFGRAADKRKVQIVNDESQYVGQAVLDMLARWPTIAFAAPGKPWDGDWKQWLIWDKGPMSGGGGNTEEEWKRTFEVIQTRGLGILRGPRDQAVLSFWTAPQDERLHPAQKPVPLLRHLISKVAFSTVIDPFMGSGTTLRAAKDLGRRAVGIEVEERYCEIAANRLRQQVLDFGDAA